MKAAAIAATVLVPLSIIVIHQVIRACKSSATRDFLKLVDGGLKLTEGTSKMEEEKDATPPFTRYRLPTDIVPQLYDLRLRTDLEAGTFDGTVFIEVTCVTETSVVRLHSRGLEIDVKDIRVNELQIKGVEVPKENSDNDFLIIKLKEKLTEGKDHLVSISFSGKLDRGDLNGYLLTKYKQVDANANNQVINKLLAVTQFEPAYARKAFPCFDEPHLKANFTVHLGHKQGYKAVSSMPLKQTTKPDMNGWVWNEFMTSETISTYSIAFVVSDLEMVNSLVDGDQLSYKIWSRHEMGTQLAFVSQNMPQLVKRCETYFNINLPLKNMAIMAVPNLSHEAKQNWGLITFREENILIHGYHSSIFATLQAGSVLVRELAQQWLGSLVTMNWWSDFWLSKGIASWVSPIVIDLLNLESSGFFDYSNGMSLLKVFSLDSFQSSSPISVPIENPRNLNQISDDMTYHKGFLVINMINSIVGMEEFQTGVSAFLNEFKYKATGEDEFWKAVAKDAAMEKVLPPGVSLKDVVDSWTKQAGYPVLTFKREGQTVTVSQKRFFKGKPKSENVDNSCWFVPVTFSNEEHLEYSTKPLPNMWLSCKQPKIKFDVGLPSDESWMVLNNNAAGIYRVFYDEQTWEVIARILDQYQTKRLIPPLSRMQLISDAMEMAYVGQLSYQKAFAVLHSIDKDFTVWPWQAAMSSLEELRNLLIRTDLFETFKVRVQSIVQQFFIRNRDFVNRSNPVNILLAQTISLAYSSACKYNVAECQKKVKALWLSRFKEPTENWLPTLVRGTIYCEVVGQGGAAEWDKLYNYYQDIKIVTEKRLSLESLACTKEEALLKKLLDLSLDESSGIPKQDSWRVFWTTADYSKLGFEVALEFLLNNLKAIYDYNKPDTSVLAKYFEVLAKKLVFKDEINKMKQFANDNKKLLEDSWAGVTQAMEQMDINLQWHETHYDNIAESLKHLV